MKKQITADQHNTRSPQWFFHDGSDHFFCPGVAVGVGVAGLSGGTGNTVGVPA